MLVVGLLTLLLSVAGSAVAVGAVRYYANRKGVLDVPNARSSHSSATPRGGGVGITITVLLAAVLLTELGGLTVAELALFISVVLVAVIGFIDDHGYGVTWVKAIVQIVASAWVLFRVGGFAQLSVGVELIHLGVLGSGLALVGLVWVMNFYNFMDGSDAVAGAQGVCAALAGALCFLLGEQWGWALLSLVLAGACGGFLVWNWPPAKIFMGDSGSYSIGMVFGILIVIGESSGAAPALLWIILLGLFATDATLTLLKRVWLRQPWWSPHRTHSYQLLLQLGWSHQQVAGAIVAVNLLVLWPLAWLAASRPSLMAWAVVATALIMSTLWVWIQTLFSRRSGVTS